MPRRYQKMQGPLPEIKKMLESGMSQREVAESLGLEGDRPIRKWVTDISYIHTKQGVLYPSMIRDLYDNSIIAYKAATQQTVNLVLDTIRLAMRKGKKRAAAELRLHSGQGFQYTSQA